MFDRSAEFYDLFYLPMKDYPAEAATVASLLRQHNPGCHTVLDVACGTGEHARWLAGQGFAVDGVDLHPAFLRMARAKHPAGAFFEGDMRDFHLGRRYDAVISLFSAIGYARTLDGLESTLQCFREHLAPGGVVLVEPWFEPGILDPSRVVSNEGADDHVRVIRRSRVEIDGGMSRLHFDYEITDAGGVRHETEVHELGVFSVDEMLRAFRGAGFDAKHAPGGSMDRGLYVARVADER